MNILSYRGPSAGGGVATALSSLTASFHHDIDHWWHLAEDHVSDSQNRDGYWLDNNTRPMTSEILSGHYHYCNNFIWPIMHDMPEFASYDSIDHSHYEQFNLTFAREIIKQSRLPISNPCFIQDYQLALLPRILNIYSRSRHRTFWHIPWPKTVIAEHLPMIKEIASSLLHSAVIGFHTSEYVENFLNFVREHLPEYQANSSNQRVYLRSKTESANSLLPHPSDNTLLLTAPLGLDLQSWNATAASSAKHSQSPAIQAIKSRPFILSVDRADYTKGVLPRLEAIDLFFQSAPEQIGEIIFLQICQRSRPGLHHFDEYWLKCRQTADSINQKYNKGNWLPITWLDQNISQKELMGIYQDATAMMVTPLRDGLNLTAKEFIASVSENPGSLILSKGAGSWVELGDLCLAADPYEPKQMAATISESMAITPSERQRRAKLMKLRLEKQTLQNWWSSFQPTSKKQLPADLYRFRAPTTMLERTNSKL